MNVPWSLLLEITVVITAALFLLCSARLIRTPSSHSSRTEKRQMVQLLFLMLGTELLDAARNHTVLNSTPFWILSVLILILVAGVAYNIKGLYQIYLADKR